MYQASKKFGDAIAGSNRKFNTRLLENEKVLVESVKNFTITSGAEEITIGSAVASYVQATIENKGIALSGKEVSLEIGVEVDGEMEYMPMGLYTIQNPKIESNKVTFTAYDRLASRCNGAYYSKLSYPTDAVDILAEISTMTGVAIDTSTLQRGIQINQRAIIEEGDYNEETEESEVITTYVNPFDGYTYKETIGFIAGLFGKFAICGRTGMIEFRWYQGIDYEIPSNIFYNDLQETEESFSIKRLMCDNSDQTLSSGSGATGISMQNPVMTQGILDGVYNTVQGLVFTPAALRFIGDTRLDIGDIITAVKNDGMKFTIPIISLITSYDGGLMQTIASYGNTAEEDDSDTKGPITEMAERVEYELAFVKKLMVDNLTATNATIKNLSGDVLKFKTGEFENLKSDVASFKETTTTNLNAANAKIENLEANTVKASELEAKVGTFGYLKATDASLTYATITNLKAESGKIDDLQSDYATFKTATANDLKAANANIQNLTATKATITDLNAATAKISVLEGNYANLNTLVNGNLTSANIQSLTLNSKNTTIENGMIKNAMIENLAFDKITGMDINTTNLTVHSSDGKSKWTDNTIQISDANRVRVQIGKDASNDYSMSVWDKDGKLIWDALGATEHTIQRKIIRDNVVADNANISGSKLDINSVVREVNGSTTKLKSSVINMDDKNQTLDVVFNELATTVDEIEVGGRNLVKKKQIQNIDSTMLNLDNFLKNGTIEFNVKSNNGGFRFDSYDNYEPNSNYVLSYYFTKTSGTITKFGGFHNGKGNIFTKYTVDGIDYKASVYSTESSTVGTIMNDGNRHRVVACFTTPSSIKTDDAVSFSYIQPGRGNNNPNFGVKIEELKLEKGNKPTDWTPAPEDTQSQIDNISEITTSHTTSISTMQGQISSLISEDTTIKGNYDILVSKYNSTVETVNGMKTTIGEHTSSINNVSSKITTIEANLSGITTRVSASEEKFDNLQIGGVNLIKNSNFADGVNKWAPTGITYAVETDSTYGHHIKFSSSVAGDSDHRLFSDLGSNFNHVKDTMYTLSFYAKASANTQVQTNVACATNKNNYSLTTSWKRFTFTYQASATGSLTFWAIEANKDIYLANIKLERGNKATDYTVSPKDTTDAINSAETKAEQTATKFSWLVKSGDSASNVTLTDHMYDVIAQNINLTGKVTFSSLNAEAQKKINDIDTKAGNAQTSANNALTSAKQYTDNAVGGVEVGGVNLISDTRDMKSWAKGGKLTITYGQFDIKNNTNAIKVVNSESTAGNAYLEPPNRGPLSSGKYTVSFYAKTDSTSGADVSVLLNNKYTKTFKINNIWTQYIITFDVANDIPVTNNFFWFNFFGTTEPIYFCYVKLEKGNKATDWTPAPEDVSKDATNKANQALSDAKNYSSSAVNWVANNGTKSQNLYSMVSKWTDGAVSDTTQINGGWIKTNTITANKIAIGDFTNYCDDPDFENGVYSPTGTFSLSTEQKYVGTKSLKMASGTVAWHGTAISPEFYLEKDEEVYVEYYVYRNGANHSAGVCLGSRASDYGSGVYDISGQKKASANIADKTWTKISYVGKANRSGMWYASFKHGSDTALTGDWYLDHVTIRKRATGNLIVDGSITANKIATDAIKSRNYVANSTGSFLNLKDGSFDSKYLKWDASGNITAKGGTIGKYKITEQWLVTGSGSTCTGIGGNQAFWAGADSSDSAPFRVGYDGKFVSSNADISGKITATSGKVGKYEITDTYLKTGSGSTCSGFGSDYAFWAGNDEAKYAPFKVEYDGTLNIEHITVHGNQEDVYMKIGKDFLTIQDVNTSAHFGLDGFDFAWANSRIRTGDQGIELYGGTPYIDFHYDNSYADYTSRIIAHSWGLEICGDGNFGGVSVGGNVECKEVHTSGAVVIASDSESFYWAHGYQIARGTSWGGVCVGDDSQQLRLYGSSIWAAHGISTSDENLKENFTTLDQYEDFYMNLNPIGFNYIGDYDGKKTHFGFGAHKTEDILESEGYDSDKFAVVTHRPLVQEDIEKRFGKDVNIDIETEYGISYTEFIALNTHMIQKTRKDLLYQSGKIDIHEAIINDLQFKIAKMEKKIEQLTKALA